MEIRKAAEWFLLAHEDEIGANDLNKENTLNLSYYHCTQAVEKYLKGFLDCENSPINYNHDISDTLSRCSKFDGCFNNLQTECDNMLSIIKNLRYPGRVIATKEDIKDGLKLINTVKNLTPIRNIFFHVHVFR